MVHVDIIVIGAGVVGLAIAERLAAHGREVALVERNGSFGRETSSRNSEVIHCGMYYAEGLLKTRLCVRGNLLLRELCERMNIPYRLTGKIVVAVDNRETARLCEVLSQGKRNGVPGLELIGPERIREMEPHVFGVLGLSSSGSGIVDSHQLMSYLAQAACAKGAVAAYGCRATGLRKDSEAWTVETRDADGEQFSLRAGCVINSAGLQADRIAEMAGIDIDSAGYRIYPCKGEYFGVSSRHRGKLSRLVYPVPSPEHLGAHAVLGLDGSLRIGPSSFHVDEVDYTVDPSHLGEFHEKAVRFLPFLERQDLVADMAGVRPKLYPQGGMFRDFVIREESDRGMRGLVNLIGIESPGLTACLAIAEAVEQLI